MKEQLTLISLFFVQLANAQLSQVWRADNGNGTYKNPIIHADYSDPDLVRVGNNYYMIASSFNNVPGLPILQSADLVNWKLIGYALKKLSPVDRYNNVQHGGGVWAPAIRYHNNEFYIYYPDPDLGIYLIRAKNILGPWSEPVLIAAGKGLIDPCPFWDDDGKAYLVHAYAGSRAGIKSILVINELNNDGTKIINDAVMVYDGHEKDPTIEGPKLYKHNKYYYIFAPAGGVSTGWQTVLRSRNIYGPYERKVVMEQGSTDINGPHQGGWVTTQTGEDWFIHFQDKEAYGRVVCLEPMKWVSDWPVIGIDKDADGKGEPVTVYKKPNVGRSFSMTAIPASDEFNDTQLGLQWQWQTNPQEGWAFTSGNGHLRMYCDTQKDSFKNYWMLPNMLLQKFPAETFTATAKISFHPAHEQDRIGLVVFGTDYSFVSVVKNKNGNFFTYNYCMNADKNAQENESVQRQTNASDIYVRVSVAGNAVCSFSFSDDGTNFESVPGTFKAVPGKWVGARIGFFCTGTAVTNDEGYADIDWIKFTK